MLLLPLALAAAAAAATPTVAGDWQTQANDAVVRIQNCGPAVCGTVIRILNPNAPPTDANNPDASLRSRPLVGIPVLSGFAPDESGELHGTSYDPHSGHSYRTTLSLNADGSLKVRGCVTIICETQTWRRVP